MIKVMGYGITASDACYLVGKVTKSRDKTTGEEKETISNPAYATNFKGALEIVRKKLLLECVRNQDGELVEAIESVKATENQFYSLLEKIKF